MNFIFSLKKWMKFWKFEFKISSTTTANTFFSKNKFHKKFIKCIFTCKILFFHFDFNKSNLNNDFFFFFLFK